MEIGEGRLKAVPLVGEEMEVARTEEDLEVLQLAGITAGHLVASHGGMESCFEQIKG